MLEWEYQKAGAQKQEEHLCGKITRTFCLQAQIQPAKGDQYEPFFLPCYGKREN